MCQFKSAIIDKAKNFYYLDNDDSHENIVSAYNLNDKNDNLQRLEFTPTNNNYINLNQYQLVYDNERQYWFNDSFEKFAIRQFKLAIKKMIINKDTPILKGRQYIINGNIKIHNALNSIIIFGDNATIKNAGHSTIKDAGSSTIKNAGCSTIEDAEHSTIENAGRSTIKNAGHSTIKDAEHSTIENAWYSTIENAWCSTIENAGSSTIKSAGCSTIKNAGSSTIENAGSSTIKNAGCSTIEKKNKAKILK